MRKYLRLLQLCCTLLCAVAANAQDASFDLKISSVASPQTGMQISQPVTILVRNNGTDTIPSFRVGIIKNGKFLFEEEVDTCIAKWKIKTSDITVTLKQKVDFEWGEKDTLLIYAKANGGVDTNEANDTTTQYVNMPVLRSYPYSWDSTTAASDFYCNKWEYDETKGVFYYFSTSLFKASNAVVTPAFSNVPTDKAVTCDFKYHAASATQTLQIIAEYENEKDTVYTGSLAQATGESMIQGSASFYLKGLCRLHFNVTNSTKYDECWLSDINLHEAAPDLMAAEIVSPAIYKLVHNSAGYPVTVRYINNSPFDIANPKLCYKVSESAVSEDYEGTMTAGDTLDYTFKTPMTVGTADSVEFVAWCEAEGDTKLDNDTVRAEYGFYDPQSFPYTTKFEEGNDLWQAIDTDRDGSTWQFSTLNGTGGCAYYPSASAADATDLLISPAISMPAGLSRISFYYSGFMKTGTENLSVLLSTTPDTLGVKKELFTQSLENNGWLNGFSLINLDEAGTYYFIFKAAGKGDRIYLDNLYIDRGEDLCINDVTFDTESGFGKTTSKVTLSYINHGVTTQKDVTVRYYLNEVKADEQTVAATIEPGDTLYYTFEKPADISAPDSTYQLKGLIVTAIGEDQDNDSIYGQSVSNWPIQQTPYHYGFDDTDRNTYWLLSSDTEGTATKWAMFSASSNAYSTKMVLRHNGKVAAGTKDWAYSECINIPKGRYEVSFFYRTNVNNTKDTNKKDFNVSLGKDRTPEAMTTNIAEFEDVLVSGQFYKKFNGTLEVEEDGNYFLGFCSTSSTCGATAQLMIDDIEIKPISEGTALPYTADLANDWTRYNPKKTNPYWDEFIETDDTKVMRVNRTKENSDLSSGFEDKLVSPKLKLDAGKKVIMTVNYALSSDSTNTTLDIFTGHIDNSDSLELVASMPIVADSAYAEYEYTFTATEADSSFYVGFRTNTPVELTSGYIYDARLKSVSLEYDPASSIGGTVANGKVNIIANEGCLTITAPEAVGRIDVCDLSGRTVMSVRSDLSCVTLDCSALHGVYIVKAATADGTAVKKVMLK